MKRFLIFFKTDCRLLLARGEAFSSTIFFCFLVLLVFQIVLPGSEKGWVFPLIWVGTLFGGLMRLNRSFESEQEGRVWDALRENPGTAVPFFTSKLLANLLYLLILELLIFVMAVALFHVIDGRGLLLAVSGPLLLGSIGFATVGTTFSAMLVGLSRKDLILPVISYPLIIPVVVGVIKSVEFGADNSFVGYGWAWIVLLGGFDIVYAMASLLVFDLIMEG